jgi:hypothetical protein
VQAALQSFANELNNCVAKFDSRAPSLRFYVFPLMRTWVEDLEAPELVEQHCDTAEVAEVGVLA